MEAGNVPNNRPLEFKLPPGFVLNDRYIVEQRLGCGWEGEVYKVVEKGTGIARAAKLFFPQRNRGNSTARRYAVKLHKLRDCKILIQYINQETIELQQKRIRILVSEYVEGELLTNFLNRQRGRFLPMFESIHLLHALAAGVAEIHLSREYHGDLHSDNVIVRRFGLGFDIKLIDMYNWGAPSRANIAEDVCNLVRIFYDILGGSKRYARLRPEVKAICCGLKRSLILRKFPTAAHLRDHIESIHWD